MAGRVEGAGAFNGFWEVTFMSLLVHELIHILLATLAGFVVYKIWGKLFASLLTALIGGVLIDLDHLIDYYIAFGFKFRLNYFLSGFEFLKNEKIYEFFHAWEWVVLFILLILFFKNRTAKSIFLALALGVLLHLAVDMSENGVSFMGYSFLNRLSLNFSISEIISNENYQRFLRDQELYKSLYK